MVISIPQEVEPVVKRARILGIPLTEHIDEIITTYVQGGVKGIKFRPKNYHGLKQAVDRAIRNMVLLDDNFADSVGMIMGSDARRHGYLVSAREKNPANSLHVELSPKKCDIHLDSHSITTGEAGFPMWGGQYNPMRFIPHGIKDLAPSMLADSRFSFASPVLAPILSRLDLQLGIKGNQLMLDGNSKSGRMGKPLAKEKFHVGFTLTFGI